MVKDLLGLTLRRLTGYDMVRVACGVLLLAAAGLKGYQLATEPVLGTGMLDSRLLLTATVEFELLFGLWLLANLWPKLSWAAAMGCFSLFACVSLYKALSGDATCGRFGRYAGQSLVDRGAGLGGRLVIFALATEGSRLAVLRPFQGVRLADGGRLVNLARPRPCGRVCNRHLHRCHAFRGRGCRRQRPNGRTHPGKMAGKAVPALGLHRCQRPTQKGELVRAALSS